MLRPMCRVLLALTVFAFVVTPSGAADDPIATKLTGAKEEYAKEFDALIY